MRISAVVTAVAAMLLITAPAQANPPTATTGGAKAITQTGARLTGTVRPNNGATSWHFDYGTTTTYGASTPEAGPIPAGSGTQNVQADVTGLTPGTLYHFRVVATNPSGSIPGKDHTFTTRSAVSIAVAHTSVPFGRSETITGQVFGTTVGGITVTLQENPYPYSGFNEISTTTTDTTGHYQFIRPVLTNTAYRVVAQTKPPGTSQTAFAYEQDVISIKASTSRPKRGHSVLFTGFNEPGRVGLPIDIQRFGSHGWRTVIHATLTATTVANSASYAVRLKGRKLVSGAYRAYSPGGFDHLPGASATRHISVRR